VHFRFKISEPTSSFKITTEAISIARQEKGIVNTDVVWLAIGVNPGAVTGSLANLKVQTEVRAVLRRRAARS
jgi:hypothetical protein